MAALSATTITDKLALARVDWRWRELNCHRRDTELSPV
jgi:hypothetical protein